MRTRFFVLTAALLVASAPAWAQEPRPTPRPEAPAVAKPAAADILGGPIQKGTFEVGLVGSDIDGDPARFQRYRDLRNGASADLFRYTRDEGRWFLDLGGDHIGRRDQRYFVTAAQPGKVKASFVWDQVPLYFSNDTKSLFQYQGDGVFRIDDSIQRGIETKQFTLASVVGQATPFTTRNRRDTAAFGLVYTARPDLDVKFNLKSFTKDGNMPWGATLGFNNATEIALPIDTRTTDVNTAIEWGSERGNFSVGYLGSWYNNHIQTIVWDNPIKITDSTYGSAYAPGDGTSQGRMSIWPSNTMHTVTAAGSLKLPARSRAAAFLSIGSMNQNEPLLPYTINTAIPEIHLDRTTADAEARTLATNLTFTSRPNRYFRLNARYRFYDFDNRTPHFEVHEYVRFDQVIEEFDPSGVGKTGPEPYSIKRQNLDLDASFTGLQFATVRLGYGRAQADRTYRIFEETVENTVRLSVDSVGNQYVTLRARYEHGRRDGNGFDVHPLLLAAEQPGMRHFDIATRDRDRITAIVTVTPVAVLGLNFSLAAGKDDYDESEFGLRDNDHRNYTVGFDLVPSDQVNFNFAYGREKYTALQWTRNAAPGVQFTDPSRNWNIDSEDAVNSVNAALDLAKVFPKTDLRLAYDYSKSKATYVYGLVANSPLAVPEQLPPVRNELQRATVDARYFVTEKLALGVGYWFDKYAVQDFALNNPRIAANTLSGSNLIGYMYRPYTANTGWLRLMYLW